jgi:hypothetical protein
MTTKTIIKKRMIKYATTLDTTKGISAPKLAYILGLNKNSIYAWLDPKRLIMPSPFTFIKLYVLAQAETSELPHLVALMTSAPLIGIGNSLYATFINLGLIGLDGDLITSPLNRPPGPLSFIVNTGVQTILGPSYTFDHTLKQLSPALVQALKVDFSKDWDEMLRATKAKSKGNIA